MAVNILLALFQVLEWIPIEVKGKEIAVRNGNGWHQVCAAIGYLDVGIVWIYNLFIIWTMLYMLSLSWHFYRIRLNQQVATPRDLSKFYEIVAIIFVILSPFLLN